MTAHQRQIRESLSLTDPRPVNPSLDGFCVQAITAREATPLILRYEWLGNIGRAVHFIGLFSPETELQGVVCFGHGPAGRIRSFLQAPALCLERGACVHYAPPNAASFLVNRACKLVYRTTDIACFFAYADPMAGEYGGVYQAAGWLYLGQGLDGEQGRVRRCFVLPPGGDAANPSHWRTTRALRREGKCLSFTEAQRAGWQIAFRQSKHVYVTHVGKDRRNWRARIGSRPYPKPNSLIKKCSVPSKEPARAGIEA